MQVLCVSERAFVKVNESNMTARLQLVVHQEREHPNPGRWKEESKCPGAFLGSWTTGEKAEMLVVSP